MPPIYILRHGETVWNRVGRQQGRGNSPLTPLGRVQAARQGAILRRADAAAMAQVSPLSRARHSAALAGLEARTDPRLVEIDMGTWSGASRAEIGAPITGVTWKFNAPGGEGRAAFVKRLRAVLSDLDVPTILVTHGMVSIGLRGVLLGLDPDRWDELDDPQGVVHRVREGHVECIA